jgi:hypothetical protein
MTDVLARAHQLFDALATDAQPAHVDACVQHFLGAHFFPDPVQTTRESM